MPWLLKSAIDDLVAGVTGAKIHRYAAAGIPEAWLVDLVGDAVSVCRRPGSNGYGEIVTVTRGGTLRPLLLPGLAIGVDDILG